MRFVAFDRWGNQKGTITDIFDATWAEEINGEDTLTISTTYPLIKGDRIVWQDHLSVWHEHTVASIRQEHSGASFLTATCENSISELYGDWIEERSALNLSASQALAIILVSTRWEMGNVSVLGANTTNWMRISAREALSDLIEKWGGELSTTIVVDDMRVIERRVNLTMRGVDTGRRFAYGSAMSSIARIVDTTEVKTALYGFGKGETGNDGVSRGITFAEVNAGKAYVEDLEALRMWGRPDDRGGVAHVFGKVEFSDCEDKQELLRLTKAQLARASQPHVSYEATVEAFGAGGLKTDGLALGDTVSLVDRESTPEIRVMGRVMRVERNMLDRGRATVMTIGNMQSSLVDIITNQYHATQALTSRAAAWDSAATADSGYVNKILQGMNAIFDAGASYLYQSATQGIIIADVPLDQKTGRPTRTPAKAIQLKGGGFRIASSVDSSGDFAWRAFGSGSGFIADEIVAGTLRGGNTHFDLETGTITTSGNISGVPYTLTISPTGGFQIFSRGQFIGGIEVSAGQVILRAARCGTTPSTYITTGTTIWGNAGVSCVDKSHTPVKSAGNYLDVESLHMQGSPANQVNGVGFSCFDKPFMDASTHSGMLRLYSPTYDNDYTLTPKEHLILKNNYAKLQGWNNSGIEFTTETTRWNYDTNTGVWIGRESGDRNYLLARAYDTEFLKMGNSSLDLQFDTGNRLFMNRGETAIIRPGGDMLSLTDNETMLKYGNNTYLSFTDAHCHLRRRGGDGIYFEDNRLVLKFGQRSYIEFSPSGIWMYFNNQWLGLDNNGARCSNWVS